MLEYYLVVWISKLQVDGSFDQNFWKFILLHTQNFLHAHLAKIDA